jgi:hypothetical protein
MRRTSNTFRFVRGALHGAIVIAVGLLLAPASHAQLQPLQPSKEVVANLASGRVIIWFTHDAMLVGAVSHNTEPGSHSPLFVPLNNGHVAVLLGAVEWQEPNSGKAPVRLDTVLQGIQQAANHSLEGLQPNEAGDIEVMGMTFLNCLRPVVADLHHEVPMKSDQPLVQVVLAGYEKDYGPEAWVLTYHLQQRELRDDYWDTLVSRPDYTQLYPPEKKDPRTLLEVRFPADAGGGPTLAELLGENDPRLVPLRSADPKVGQAVQQLVDGAGQKADSVPATTFFQAALKATSAPDAKLTLAILHEGDRFDWIIPPPEGELKPGEQKRDSDAPTLRAPHHQN